MVTEKRTCSCSSSADLAVLTGDQAAVLGRMEEAVEVLLRGLGEDPTREGLRDTPRRVAKAWLDIASGYTQECTRAFGKALFHEPIVSSGSNGLVVVRDITFAALCEHTLLPFHGRCHIAYVPRDGVVLGLSKLARVTKCLASRLQRQEAFTHNLVEAVQREVGPHGVAVVVQANHLGGPSQPQMQVSWAACGCFQDSRNGLLTEFLTLLRLSGVSAAGALLSSMLQGQAAVTQVGSVTETAPLSQQLAAATPAQQLQGGALARPAAAVKQHEGSIAGVSVMDMAAAVRVLLEGVGEEPSRQGLKGSAERYVQWLFASTSGSRMPPASAFSACEAHAADAAASEDELPCGRDSSPEPPATPADHSPDASCASSDMAPDEPLPCGACLVSASSPMQADVIDDLEEAAVCQLGLGQGQQQQQAQLQQLAGHVQPVSCGHVTLVGGSQCTSLALQQQLQSQLGAGSRSAAAAAAAAAAGRVHTFCTQFASQCEHHLLPFYGTLRLAYQLRPAAEGRGRLSERAVAGQLRHIVDRYSKRLQVQERLSHQVADATLATLGAASVLVVIDSAHMCMVARGVEKHASSTLTTASRGLWAGDSLARARAMEALLAQ